ncbi:hypothetical protein KIPB_004147 [Kipferlia bialata]|uniref:Uncharacterized protein n=1 Tax=Kipferlia bialata TaxID=797122 RepID=A0A9K3GHW9_9EUKA|nr:hypothetical protein KIPB_004147 [Kipferlia bialata]|eukprot:g4147.t1
MGQEKLKGRPVLAPTGCIPMLRHLCATHAYLNDGVLPEDPFTRCGMHEMGVDAGDCIEVPGLQGIEVEVVKCYHNSCETVGYGFSIKKNKLKAEYIGLDKEGIIALRKSGTCITESVRVPQVIFFGDTTPDALTQHTEWQKYPNVFIECTACSTDKDIDAEVSKMRDRGHTHIAELKPILEAHAEGRRWFLQHASAAHKDQELIEMAEGIEADVVIVEDYIK